MKMSLHSHPPRHEYQAPTQKPKQFCTRHVFSTEILPPLSRRLPHCLQCADRLYAKRLRRGTLVRDVSYPVPSTFSDLTPTFPSTTPINKPSTSTSISNNIISQFITRAYPPTLYRTHTHPLQPVPLIHPHQPTNTPAHSLTITVGLYT